MSNLGKKAACDFMKEFRVTDLYVPRICEILDKQGYTVVYFNSLYNEPNVANLIRELNLAELIKDRRGFTYADINTRIVFVNEDLSEQEKLLVLLHEEGHIYCGHLKEQSVIGRDVIQEYEANEFVHYMLNATPWQKLKSMLCRHRKLVLIASVILVLLTSSCVTVGCILRNQAYYGEFYITQTGTKYHKKDCIFVKDKNSISRLTKEQFESGAYEPCKICLPDD